MIFALVIGLFFGYIAGSVFTGRGIKDKLYLYFYEKGYIGIEAKREVDFIFSLEE